MSDLTYLEIGIELTELEKELIRHPVFQKLRELDRFPFRFGTAVSGLSWVIEDNKAKWTTVNPLTVNKAGEYVDECVKDLRSMAIFLARVIRDGQDPRDVELVKDLSAWMDGLPYFCRTDFRWAREFEALKSNQARAERERLCAEQLQGDANVSLLLLNRLSEREQESVYSCLAKECQQKIESFEQMSFRYLVRFRCIECGNSAHKSGTLNCLRLNVVALIDVESDAKKVMGWLPESVRRFIKPVRFLVPRITFREDPDRGMILPEMLVFDLSTLDRRERKDIFTQVCDLHADAQSKAEQSAQQFGWTRRHDYRKTQLCLPTGRQHPNAVILAGSLAGEVDRGKIGAHASSKGWPEKGVAISFV